MIPASFFLAAAIEAFTLAAVFICLCGEDADDKQMKTDAWKVFIVGSGAAALAVLSHFAPW